MTKVLWIIALLGIPNMAMAEIKIFGKPIQGAMLVGKTEPNAQIVFDGITQSATSTGIFVIGLHRDAPEKMTIRVKHNSGNETKTIYVKQRSYNEQRINGLPPKKVTPPDHVLKRIIREINEIKKVRSRDTRFLHYTGKWQHPTTGIITGVYGSRRILNSVPKNPHYGIDYANKRGTLVTAPKSGIVRLVQMDNYYSGKTIFIDHGMGIISAYLHLKTTTVKPGQKVSQGDKIGEIGTTGRSTGPHLDWRINWFDKRLDPGLLQGIDLGTNASGKTVSK